MSMNTELTGEQDQGELLKEGQIQSLIHGDTLAEKRPFNTGRKASLVPDIHPIPRFRY